MSLTASTSTQCVNHPAREGVGICMAGCRRVFCVECSTKIDGINTCLGCLQEKVRVAPPAPGLFPALLNHFFGWLVLILGSLGLVSLLSSWGLAVARSEDGPEGNRVFLNWSLIEGVGAAVEQFKTDTGRYPSMREGLQALDWPSDRGSPPKGYRGPYWPTNVTLNKGLPIDAYQSPIHYLLSPRLPGPILISPGADKVRETDASTLASDQDPTAAEWRALARGDDVTRLLR